MKNTPRHSPGLAALIGCEMEIGGTRVYPFVPKASRLAEGDGWHLETDRIPNREEADLEFILHPSRDLAQLEKALDQVVGLMARLRTLALQVPQRRVRLSQLGDACPQHVRIVREAMPLELELRDAHCVARLQPTSGVGLADIAAKLDGVCSPETAYKILLGAERVERRFREARGEALTPACRGFVQLIVYYLSSASGVTPKAEESTVHVFFRMLARSDFCAMHDKLLDERDRAQMRIVLQSERPRSVPLLMEALAIEPHISMFKSGYMSQNYTRERGPLVRHWLESIVRGRDEGQFKKDLLSPPAGYPFHSGDLDRDYGMGAMGVDEALQLALFEIRYSPRLQHDVPLNGHARHALRLAYADAARHNPGLARADDPSEDDLIRYAYLYRYEAVYGALKKLRKRMRVHADGPGGEAPTPLAPAALAARVKVARLQRETVALGRPPWLAEVNICLQTVEDRLDVMTGQADAAIAASTPAFIAALDEFEQALWQAGS